MPGLEPPASRLESMVFHAVRWSRSNPGQTTVEKLERELDTAHRREAASAELLKGITTSGNVELPPSHRSPRLR